MYCITKGAVKQEVILRVLHFYVLAAKFLKSSEQTNVEKCNIQVWGFNTFGNSFSVLQGLFYRFLYKVYLTFSKFDSSVSNHSLLRISGVRIPTLGSEGNPAY